MTKTTKTVAKKPVAKKAVASKKVTATKKPSGKKPAITARRKVTTAIARQIQKMLSKQEAKEGRFNIAAVARHFGLSTVTIVNVQTNRYGYLPA